MVISDCWYNFLSDHKYLTLRITSYANDKPLITIENIKEEAEQKKLDIDKDLFVKPEYVPPRKKIKVEKVWKDSDYEKTSDPYLSSLKGERWLTNFVIDDYLALLQRSHHDTFIFSSHFTESFFSCNRPYNMVSRYCKNVNLLEKKLVFFPVLSSSHWFLIVLSNECNSLSLYDPYIKESSPQVLKSHHDEFLTKLENGFLNLYCIEKLSHTKTFSRKILLPPELPEQLDSFNCGVFLLEFCRHICYDAAFSFKSHNMAESRERMFKELQNDKLSTFIPLGNENLNVSERRILNVDKVTCWLNATLQLIFSAFDHDQQFKLFSELGCLLQQLHKKRLIDPLPVKRLLQRILTMNKQINMLGSLDIDYIMIGQQCARDFWILISGNRDLFKDIFEQFLHTIEQRITCTNCNHVLVKKCTSLYLEESCPSDNTSLKTFLENYFNQNQIAEDFCCEEGCATRGNYPKKITIVSKDSSNFLLVILLRSNFVCYDEKTNTTTRVNSYGNKIDIIKDLNIIDNEDKNVCYQPVAVIPHTGVSGQNSSGHYTCYIKRTNGCWVNCDDEKKQTIVSPIHVTKKGYIVLYKRKSLT